MFGLAAISGLQASEFRNLDFESANTNNLSTLSGTPYSGATADLVPNWSLKNKSGEAQPWVFYNSGTPGGLPYAILQVNDSHKSFPIDGKYGLLLIGDSTDPLYLSQTGTIPSDSRYITFVTCNHVSLSINGTPLELSETKIWEDDIFRPFNTGYQVWADVAPYAGQEVNLTFGSNIPQQIAPGCGVDSIQFVSTVPEPSAIVLFGLGCIGFLIRKSRLQK